MAGIFLKSGYELSYEQNPPVHWLKCCYIETYVVYLKCYFRLDFYKKKL